MNNSIFSSAIQQGDFIAPAELATPPSSSPVSGRALLWALTLLSFLGGTYYGYLFRRAAVPADAQLLVVDEGGALVARWNGKSPAFAVSDSAQLRVTSGSQQFLIPLDKTTLAHGQVKLDVDPTLSAKVELAGKGISGQARFLAGDPLDTTLIHADAASLRQQIIDQQQLNRQMEQKLATIAQQQPAR